jgi:hypothetical protein
MYVHRIFAPGLHVAACEYMNEIEPHNNGRMQMISAESYILHPLSIRHVEPKEGRYGIANSTKGNPSLHSWINSFSFRVWYSTDHILGKKCEE